MPTRIASDLPPIQGSVKRDALRCEEVLGKKPCGEGAWWWIRVRNTGLSLKQARAAIARTVHADAEVVQVAGSRDRQADMTQWFCLPAELVEHEQVLGGAGYKSKLRVTEFVRHNKPLDWTQVVALDWQVRIAGGAKDDGFRKATDIFRRLRTAGVPNYLPASLLGRGAQLAKWGRLAALGRPLPAAVQRGGHSQGRLLQAAQAQLYNHWLAQRLEDGLFASLVDGDVVETGCNRFPEHRDVAIVDDAAAWQARFDAWEVVPMGPMYGPDLLAAEAQAGAREQAILTAAEYDQRGLSRFRPGRRAMRVQPTQVTCDIDKGDLVFSCRLPCDASIKVLIEELLQPEGHL